jgi:hypothetical protein
MLYLNSLIFILQNPSVKIAIGHDDDLIRLIRVSDH